MKVFSLELKQKYFPLHVPDQLGKPELPLNVRLKSENGFQIHCSIFLIHLLLYSAVGV